MHPPPRPRATGMSNFLEGRADVVGQICLPLIGIGIVTTAYLTNLPDYLWRGPVLMSSYLPAALPTCLVEKMAYISHGSNVYLYKRASKYFHVIKLLLITILIRLAYITFIVSCKAENFAHYTVYFRENFAKTFPKN